MSIRMSIRRQRMVRLGVACCLIAGALASSSTSAAAQAESAGGGIRVVQVEGLLDPPTVDLVTDSINDANRDGASLVVLQLAAEGATGTGVNRAVDAILQSRVPVAAWVGPSGSGASGAAAVLFQAAAANAVAPGSSVGAANPQRLDTPSSPSARSTEVLLIALASSRGRAPGGAARLAQSELSAAQAQQAGVSDATIPTVGEFIVSLDGRTVAAAGGAVKLSTAKVVGEGEARRRQPNQEVRFIGLGLVPRAVHTLTSPSIAYLLLVVGLSLILFEFFTISIGIAGAVGALSLIGAFIGFANLPVQWWAIALIATAVVAFGVDVQAGSLGFWSVMGTVLLIAGSITLYGGASALDPAWWVIALVCVGTVIFMLGGMTSIVRSRFSTPTIGREDLVGEMGTAAVAVAPDGVVDVRGARWRARTNRATPIDAGSAIRVVAVEGLVLEVEPESGGARDYRERARKR